MKYIRSKPTNWNSYHHTKPTNPFIKWFFLDVMVRAYKDLLKHASYTNPPSILELGSGTGYVTKELSLFLESKKVCLVDSNPGMLKISKATFNSVPVSAKFLSADFFTLDTKEKFDLVHSGGVVEHFEPDKQIQLIKLHYDLLKPGGYCIIFVPTPTISYKILRRLAEILNLWKYTDEIPLTESELTNLVQKCGFKILGTNYFWKNYWLSEVGVIAQKIN